MCSRFRSIEELEALVAMYGTKASRNFEFNPNVAPTESVPIVRSSKSEGVTLTIASFGLIHPWAKDKKKAAMFINARSETIDKLSAFRKAFAERRCVVPVTGFYEWREENGKKIPYMVHRKDDGIISLAGIWEFAEIENEKLFSFSIITGPPSKLTEPLHDRTPIILHDPRGWIDEGGPRYFEPPNDNELEITRKNPKMNKPTFKDVHEIDNTKVEDND